MFQLLKNLFTLSCRHHHVTQPFTNAAPVDYARHTDWQPISTTKSQSHYVVCLDCGRKFGYDWSKMKVMWN